jgi:hypothetical protein
MAFSSMVRRLTSHEVFWKRNVPTAARLANRPATIVSMRTEGVSWYFLDPNGHKLEIHASDLTARLRKAREQPWVGLEFFCGVPTCDTMPPPPYG